VDHMIIGSI